ncbi:hypothetical protein RRG08_027839 [Elysia crispata]|uniref:Uncharacterized protein n=1 Tax=Elysia crispata TaxID=231223 RepID=A0AAE1BB45_9GAST|nr:hypothetical protein RRG08_027839 [Elysia crispata]
MCSRDKFREREDLENRNIESFKNYIVVNNVNQKGQPFFELQGPETKGTKNYSMKQHVLIKYAQGKEQSSQIT